MSNEDMAGAEAAASYGLSDVAESLEVGAVPYDRLLAGGRRRLRRRRLLTGGAAAVLVVAVAGAGTAIGGYGREAGGASVAAVSSAAAIASGRSSAPGPPSASGTPSASGSPTAVAAPAAVATPTLTPTASAAASGTARDPFTPIRVKVREGTVNGHALEAWVALWPAAPTAEDGLKQSRLIWAERRAADAHLPPSPEEGGNPAWDPHTDRVDVYLIADGKRQPGDFVEAATAPGGTAKADSDGVIKGVMLNRLTGEASRPDMVVVPVGPEVAKVVVSWKTGGSVEAVPVAVGDSPVHWYAVVRSLGSTDNTATSYAADGSVLRAQTTWW
ncbi:hypothetical protein ACIG5E_02625 [Kitasatospora sp. NPDC053057]|uniref:hypothetical protein n=1 Tax=Kitasatospora sp. NPDC053057 TaxID=3364062 RepID=UPI0037C60073